MTEYVRKVDIADIDKGGQEKGLWSEKWLVSVLSGAGEAGKMEVKAQFVELELGLEPSQDSQEAKGKQEYSGNWELNLGEIASLKAIELEALHEKYYMTKEARIKLLENSSRQ